MKRGMPSGNHQPILPVPPTVGLSAGRCPAGIDKPILRGPHSRISRRRQWREACSLTRVCEKRFSVDLSRNI